MVFTRENPPNGFYVYAYIRADDLTPYYIGKGKDKRAWVQHKGTSIPKDLTKIIILEHNLTEIGAFALERRLIRWWGRKDNKTGILINRTDGGEGSSGLFFTDEHKAKIVASNKGRIISTKTRAKLSASHKGKKLSNETRAKLREINLGSNHPMYGKTHTAEVRKIISDSQKGKIVSEETRAKLSAARKGKKLSETTKEKMRRPKSDETRAKMSGKRGPYKPRNAQ